LFCLLTVCPVFGQVNWADDIAPIVFTRCAHCHHEGGIAPFELLTYNDMESWASLMPHVIEENEMPPWPADPEYRHFANEDVLTDDEKQMFLDWLEDGLEPGDLNQAPLPPEFGANGSLLDTIDFTVAIEPYTLQTNLDEYRWFVVENPFNQIVFVNRIEVEPGLEHVVHHADLSYDLTGNSLENDLADPLPGFNGSTGGPTYSFYMNAWQPGAFPMRFPEGWGMAVPPGGHFVVEIHYGPGGVLYTDSTIMNLQFVADPQNVRAVTSQWTLYDSPPVLLNGPLFIPANEIVTFNQESMPLSNDISLISICPHMHFLGSSYKIWAITPDQEQINLVDVPHWDFHWQKYYVYPSPLRLPQGTVIYSEGVYDNTVDNHDNPNNPPVNVSKGLKTTDEMFLTFMTFADYQVGDEDINMEQLLELEYPEPEPVGLSTNDLKMVSVYPNPADDYLFIDWEQSVMASIIIYNVDGKQMHSGYYDRGAIDVSKLSAGLYTIEINSTTSTYFSKFVKD